MLEFNALTLALEDYPHQRPLSLLLRKGQGVMVVGSNKRALHVLVSTLLGRRPMAQGKVLWRGEEFTGKAAAFFRCMVAYIPPVMVEKDTTVESVLDGLNRLHHHKSVATSQQERMQEWARIGLSPAIASQSVASLSLECWQLLLVAEARLKHKKIVVIEEVVSPRVTEQLQQLMKEEGCVVVATTMDEAMASVFDKYIMLDECLNN